ASAPQELSTSASNLATLMGTFNTAMDEIVRFPVFEDPTENGPEVVELLHEKMAQYYCFTSFVDLDGYDYITGHSVANEPFFLTAMQGQTYVSTAIKSEESINFIVARPAIVDDQLLGVIYMTPDYDYMFSLADASSVGETGETYVINSAGKLILGANSAWALQQNDTAVALGKTSEQAALESEASRGEVGNGNFSDGIIDRVAGYAPVPNVSDWVLVTTVETTEFTGSIPTIIAIATGLSVAVAILFILYLKKSMHGFIDPVNLCIDRISQLAQGDLTSPVPVVEGKNEAARLAHTTNTIVSSLSALIAEERYLLEEVAKGNFTVENRNSQVYIGDFAPLHASFSKIISNLNSTLTKISAASGEVTAGADRVSHNSTSLAEGAVSQADSTTKLSDALDLISEQVASSTGKAVEAKTISLQTEDEIRVGNQHMQELLDTMQEISSSSEKIGKIITILEDIAFQTNILALNASVEAARAGDAGRGFSVVAQEVRNLANRSSDNVKETDALISATLAAVKKGTIVAKDTATSLEQIEGSVEQAIHTIEMIAYSMEQQTTNVEEITSNMHNISQVIQVTSSTSQESASTSQHLSDQAVALNQLLEQFSLKS
ncbi:MAG: methyl-accepting chemotaxis protein, partial [Eubacteriales bacterium]